ncbi:ovocalyxin-32-like [Numida meleagris]|uniref:ovocalyxin-32-like n=1 Tax=Numida meleagris TaxID=8996 RepID=UPI000B3E32D1|nr:ovocalyxin-32-like [Numida meleagris]
MPGLRAALPAALLLLLSSFPPAAAKEHPWQWLPGKMRELNPNNPQAAIAARVALYHINFYRASPSLLLTLHRVLKVNVKVIPGGAVKYYLHFSTKGYTSGQNAGSCLATVLYLKKPLPVVRIECTHTQDQKQAQEEDNKIYQYFHHRTKPIIAKDIPDSHGNIEHALLPVRALAFAASCYIMLEKSKENLGFDLAQIRAVKQWIRKDNVEFEFIVAIYGIQAQEMYICHMHVIWIISHPLSLKYLCASENHRVEDGSGQELGSAAGMSHEKGGNF